MGIYIIKSIHSDWIKVGHHKVTDRKPNVYFRYINRGFYSCICPNEISNKVGLDDLTLLYWFPSLDISIEKKIHKTLKKSETKIGEWYSYKIIDKILTIITQDFKGVCELPTANDLEIAKKWASKFSSKTSNRHT
jgi:hypothetical protein